MTTTLTRAEPANTDSNGVITRTYGLSVAKFAEVSSDAPYGSMECYPSVCGNLDSYNDVIFPGAFKDCLADFLKNGFNPEDHKWEVEHLLGWPLEAEERGNALWSRMAFHSTERAQNARTIYRERLEAGKSAGISVGFMMDLACYVYFDSGAELLAFAKKNGYDLKLFDVPGLRAHQSPCQGIIKISCLKEYSLTPAPANPKANALNIKSQLRGVTPMPEPKLMHLRSICGDRGLDLASQATKWSASAAEKRLKAWAECGDAPNAKYAKAFMVVSGANDEFGNYHLPFADVVDGELKAVFSAVKSAAGALDGARGGVSTISEADQESAKRFCETYYAKAAKEFEDDTIKAPWAAEKSATPQYKGQFLGSDVCYDMCMSAVHQACYGLMSEYADALGGRGNFKDLSHDDTMDSLGMAHGEHKDLCMSVYDAVKSGNGAETPADAEKSMKRFMLLIMSAGGLGSGLSWTKHAESADTATGELVERAVSKSEARKSEKRLLSENDCLILTNLADGLDAKVKALREIVAKSEPKDAARASEIESVLRGVTLSRAKAVRVLASV